MRLKTRIYVATLLILQCLALGCRTQECCVAYPPYGSYFAFDDRSKALMLLDGRLRIEQVDLTDSTRILDSRPAKNVISYTSSQSYVYLFSVSGSTKDTFVVKGVNRYKLVYTDRKKVDWLEFYLRSAEGSNPEQVKFNGKEILSLTVNEPVPSTFLYVLK